MQIRNTKLFIFSYPTLLGKGSKEKVECSINPTSYGLSDSVAATDIMEGVKLDSTYIAIDHLLTGKYRGHMPKYGLKSQKLNEILRFVNFEIMRFFPFVDTREST